MFEVFRSKLTTSSERNEVLLHDLVEYMFVSPFVFCNTTVGLDKISLFVSDCVENSAFLHAPVSFFESCLSCLSMNSAEAQKQWLLERSNLLALLFSDEAEGVPASVLTGEFVLSVCSVFCAVKDEVRSLDQSSGSLNSIYPLNAILSFCQRHAELSVFSCLLHTAELNEEAFCFLFENQIGRASCRERV